LPRLTALSRRYRDRLRAADIDVPVLPGIIRNYQARFAAGEDLEFGDLRIGPCVGKIGKFVCIGLNYADHAAETGAPIPKEPIIFMKATSAVVGPNDEVEIPKGAQKTDWEVELGVVIGKNAKYVPENHAMDYVAGYCVINDVSEREFQIERGGQWTKGKSADTFCPIGPWLVTADEVPNPGALQLWTEVNGERRQNSNTSDLIFDGPTLVSYISQFMTLLPGDVIIGDGTVHHGAVHILASGEAVSLRGGNKYWFPNLLAAGAAAGGPGGASRPGGTRPHRRSRGKPSRTMFTGDGGG